MKKQFTADGMTITALDIARHRNGVSGEPFYVVLFEEGGRNMLGIVFDGSVPADEGDEPNEPCDPRVAVLDRDLLAQGIIGMGDNSWRGDQFEPALVAAIVAFRKERYS